MTILTDMDSRGVDAACPGDVLVAPVIFDELMCEMSAQMPAAPIDLSFDDEPWQLLPTVQDLEALWCAVTPLERQITTLAMKLHGDNGVDFPQFVAQQRQLARWELAWIREAQHAQAAATTDVGGLGADATGGAAAAGGSGGGSSGGSEDGHEVVAGGQAAEHQNLGRSPSVSGKRRPRKAS